LRCGIIILHGFLNALHRCLIDLHVRLIALHGRLIDAHGGLKIIRLTIFISGPLVTKVDNKNKVYDGEKCQGHFCIESGR